MGNYLPIYKQIWTSCKFDNLNVNEKLVFIYLLTSPLSSNIGIFNIRLKQISCDCDIDIKLVEKSIKKMQEIKLLEYWENENLFYIYNMFKFTRGTIKSSKILYKQVLRQKQLIQNSEAWQLFEEQYTSFSEELKNYEEELLDKNSIDDS